MSAKILDKKIPSIAGLGVIVVSIVITTLLVEGSAPFQIQADPKNEPVNIQTTNISDTSFTVAYITDDSVIGTINFSKNQDQLNQIALDERDQLSQNVSEYKAHSITANNLEPNTTYYFTITSDGKKFDDNGEPYIVKTGNKISSTPSTQVPIAGSVLSPDGDSVSDGLVIVTINGAQKISGLIKSNGNYTIPINNLRTADLISYFPLSDSSVISIEAIANGYISKVDVSKNQLSPVPFIALSNNYDFKEKKIKKNNLVRNDNERFSLLGSDEESPSPSPSVEDEN